MLAEHNFQFKTPSSPISVTSPRPMSSRNTCLMTIKNKFGQLGWGENCFSSPHGFCLGVDDDIVIADTNNHRICIYDKNGGFKAQFGDRGEEEGELWFPRKIAMIDTPWPGIIGPRFVICDRGTERSRMQIFTHRGDYLRKINIRYIDIVAGLVITTEGHIVAVDSVSPTVFVITEAGDLLRWIDCSQFMREPSDIAVYNGEFYVCDFKGSCVAVFDGQTGHFSRRIGHKDITDFPNGIDFTSTGDIMVGDSHGNRFHVVLFDPMGNRLNEYECPYVKVSRCCGLKITKDGYVVTLAKNNHHALVLDMSSSEKTNAYPLVPLQTSDNLWPESETPAFLDSVSPLPHVDEHILNPLFESLTFYDKYQPNIINSGNNMNNFNSNGLTYGASESWDNNLLTSTDSSAEEPCDLLAPAATHSSASSPSAIQVSTSTDSRVNQLDLNDDITRINIAKLAMLSDCLPKRAMIHRSSRQKRVPTDNSGYQLENIPQTLMVQSNENNPLHIRFPCYIPRAPSSFAPPSSPIAIHSPRPVSSRSTLKLTIKNKFGELGQDKVCFSSPHGFCLGIDDDIVIADTNNHRICIYDKNGDYKSNFGEQGKEEGQLWYPRKIALIDTIWPGINGPRFVVCDRGSERSRMQIFTHRGHYLRKINIRYIDIVAGLVITAEGHIVAVDSVSPTVFVISEAGELLRWIDCSPFMREPSDIAVRDNIFYVCDFKGSCVAVFDGQNGHFIRRIGQKDVTDFPNGIDFTPEGDILVGDSHGNRFHVVVFDPSGNRLNEFECPYVKVSRCCGLKMTKDGFIVTLAKNNHHALVLDMVSPPRSENGFSLLPPSSLDLP